MSTSLALDYTYQYPFSSDVVSLDRGLGLRLATCGAHQEHPYFFEGRMLYPRTIGDMLIVLSNVVQANFVIPRSLLLDPVVTSSEDMLRFEGFSGCCGVYARADLPERSFEGDMMGRGTTNVDFNNPMRAALMRLRDQDDARLSVGAEKVELTRNESSVVEKKVQLPIRWIKGFSEVQAYQPFLELKVEVDGTRARQFFRTLSRASTAKRPSFITQFGKTLKISPRETSGAVRVLGINRLMLIEPLLSTAGKLRIWFDENSGTSGWEIHSEAGRFFLMISPEVYRGFSGEGQLLKDLAIGNWEKALPYAEAGLSWQSKININDLAKKSCQDEESLKAALAVLGSRGLAGYDVSTGEYFHRVLPFDLEKVEELQPRLKGANKLLESGKVKITEKIGDDDYDLAVEGTKVQQLVRLRLDQDKCTCPWFSRYQGKRGPCKHILAARMFIERQEEEAEK